MSRPTRKNNIRNHPAVKKATMAIKLRNAGRNIHKIINWSKKYVGGSVDKTITIDGYDFLYTDNTDEEDNDILCVARGGGLCFHIQFLKSEKTIILGSLGFYKKCSKNKELQRSTGTKIMIKAIVEIVMNNPDIINYTKLLVTDTSSIPSISIEDKKPININLSDMYYMSTGCTWYDSMMPLFLLSATKEVTFMNQRKNIVGSSAISYKEFLDKLPSHVSSHLLSLISLPSSIDINLPGSASQVLNYIRTDQTYSSIFFSYHDEFLLAFHVLPVSGTTWCAALRHGKILAPEHPICIHIDGYAAEKWIQIISNAEYEKEKQSRQET